MKKLITMILILALILPASALGDISAWMLEDTWTHTELMKTGVGIISLYLTEDGKAYYTAQTFMDEPGTGRSYIGSWEFTGPDTILVFIGENTEIELCYQTYNMMYDTKTRDMYFRAAMRDGDRFP